MPEWQDQASVFRRPTSGSRRDHWNDASGWNYGRGDDAAKPEYNYVREVDYCSGASIMIARELFSSLGGFDESFVPAYYEDVDWLSASGNEGWLCCFSRDQS